MIKIGKSYYNPNHIQRVMLGEDGIVTLWIDGVELDEVITEEEYEATMTLLEIRIK